jgi:hypothetical protein
VIVQVVSTGVCLAKHLEKDVITEDYHGNQRENSIIIQGNKDIMTVMLTVLVVQETTGDRSSAGFGTLKGGNVINIVIILFLETFV